jgi:hypothetical protein
MFTALQAEPGPVVMLTVTAPGADVLPWDETACAIEGPHKHSGTVGCKIEPWALASWASTLGPRWRKLHQAAARATRREGHVLRLDALAWEPQKRGAPHVHPVLRARTEAQRIAIRVYQGHLERLAPSHGFGFVDRKWENMGSINAAAYLASYFITGKGEKAALRQNLGDPNLPTRLLWVAPRLLQACGVSMRILRRVRRLWAAMHGLIEFPTSWSEHELAEAWALVMARFQPVVAQGP